MPYLLLVFINLNPLTPKVIQSFLTFDSMDRTLQCDQKVVEEYCGAACFSILPTL